jgi:hypothetical protein
MKNNEAIIAYAIGLATGFAVLGVGAVAIVSVGGIMAFGAVLTAGGSDD